MAYDHQEMRTVPPAKYERLKRWAERKPCLALMGEFSAGKSTLLNFLIEDNLLPTQATATELPPIWFSHGEASAYWVDLAGKRHPIALADLASAPMEARYVRVCLPSEILEHCDIIDTPGISDPNLMTESWRFAAAQAHMVLWCTTANQAWRETERGVWLSFPERLRRHSLLVVTRADKLVTEVDRDKVARRLVRETSDLFAGSVFIATPRAVKAKAALAAGETSPEWEASGAAALLDRLAERFEAIYGERTALLERYAAEGSGPARVTAPWRQSAGSEAAEPAGPVPTRPVRSEAEASRRRERPPAEDTADWVDQVRSGLASATDKVAERSGTVLPFATPETPGADVPAAKQAAEPSAPHSSKPPLLLLGAAAAGAEEEAAAENETGAPGVADHDDDAALRQALDTSAEQESADAEGLPSAPETAAPAISADLPEAVRAWRAIVADGPDAPSPQDVIEMIDRLLGELFAGGNSASAAVARVAAEAGPVPADDDPSAALDVSGPLTLVTAEPVAEGAVHEAAESDDMPGESMAEAADSARVVDVAGHPDGEVEGLEVAGPLTLVADEGSDATDESSEPEADEVVPADTDAPVAATDGTANPDADDADPAPDVDETRDGGGWRRLA